MSEYVSKCHGAKIYWREISYGTHDHDLVRYCEKCKEPCEVVAKEEK